MKKLPDLALGSFEAAAVMGVHFTRPRRMFDRGLITGKVLDAGVSAPTRRAAVYSLDSCNDDFLEQASRTAGGSGRPRTYADQRPVALKRLAAEKTQILFEDAIGIADAAKILQCHLSLLPYLISKKFVVSRQPWNPRTKAAKFHILSRKSVEAYRKKAARQKKS